MKKYTQLTSEQRYHIYLLNKQEWSQTAIAKSMDRNKSTISRELSRNTGKRGYRHKQADRFACDRHKEKNKAIKLTLQVTHYISEKLKEYWSPEQIVGRLELDKKANSTHKCNTSLKKIVLASHLCKNLKWGIPPQTFSRSIIH